MEASVVGAEVVGQGLPEAAGLSALEYVLSCGRSADPAARGAREILEVTWICGESVEEVRYFRPGTPVFAGDATCRRLSVLGVSAGEVPGWLGWIGAVPGLAVEEGWKYPFPLPAGLIGGEGGQRCLFAPEGRGWALEGAGLAGFVERGGARLALAQAGDGRKVEVREGEQVAVEVGGTVFVARLVAESPRLRIEPAPRDGAIGAMIGFGAFLAAAVVGAVAITPPPTVQVVEDASADPVVALWRQIQQAPEAPKAPQKAEPAGAGAQASEARGAGRIGKAARPEEAIGEAGLLGALDAVGEGALGSEGLSGAIGGAKGLIAARGTQVGAGGPFMAGRPFGGADTAAGMGDLPGRRPGRGVSGAEWGDREAGRPEVKVSAESVVLGALDRAQIDEVVKRNMAAIRYCYQRELTKDPSLAGKISVKFTIAADGTVAAASTKSSTMGSPAVEGCVSGRILRLTFPKPKGGGVVIVSYPFLFSAG